MCISRITRQFKQQLSGSKNTQIPNTSLTKAKLPIAQVTEARKAPLPSSAGTVVAIGFEIYRRVTCQHKVAPITLYGLTLQTSPQL